MSVDSWSQLQVIKGCLSEAPEITVDPSFHEVIQQIPLGLDQNPQFENYQSSSHTLNLNSQSSSHLNSIKRAFDLIKNKQLLPFSAQGLFEINRLILEKPSIQKRSVILKEIYPFPDPEFIDEGIDLLLEFYSHSTVHPFVKIVAFSQGLLSLHPFQDGNHRVTRLLLDYSLIELGMPSTKVHLSTDLLFANPTIQCNFSLRTAVQAVLHTLGQSILGRQ